ncbi:MAG: hypothetical protein WC758_08480 [Candidatus Woesearchaeota archaeon]|jgi:hypothetical protein
MTNETKSTLQFFKENKIKIHINIISGIDAGRFRNGYIIEIYEDGFLIIDDILGNKNYKFSEINNQIMRYKQEVDK